jgi:hypothetical protein
MKEGFFRIKYSDGNIIFEGNYKNDKREGFGILKLIKKTYKGEWKNSKFEGKGTLTKNNGDRYTGEFY